MSETLENILAELQETNKMLRIVITEGPLKNEFQSYQANQNAKESDQLTKDRDKERIEREKNNNKSG